MSTEQESLQLSSKAVDQELDGEGCIIVSLASSANDLGTTNEKESVNGELDLSLGAQNIDVKSKESEKNEVSELLVDKEEEPVKGHKAENLDDIESFMSLEPHESNNESPLGNENTSLPLKEKLSDSDLVWAKVRSHPWWPGQVFDASAATDKAKKHFKKGSILVSYFGDCSFAWNDASKIKPFRQHFSQMAKQSSLPDFVDAVEFALEEVSRRIEFGLACACISKEVYEKIKTQNVINPGIREESSRLLGGDKVSSVSFFEPAKLVGYVKRLASSPSFDGSDELQFVSQRAKLLAFSRWKGFTDLPEFEILQGSVESAPKISHTEKESSLSEVKVKESAPETKKTKQVYTKRRKTEDDGVFEYEDTTVPKKREQTLAEFIAEKRLSKSNGKRSHESSVMKLDGEKKRKAVHEKLPKTAKKIKTKPKTEDSGSPGSIKNDQKITPKKAKTSFGIGASILRVANQMHCSSPTGLVPCSKNSGSGKSLKDRSKPEALFEREPSPSETLASHHSTSATKTSNGKANPISIDKIQSGELEHVEKETPSTNIVEDLVLEESRDLKDSSEMVNEDRKEAENIVGEKTIEDSKLTEEKITGSDLKEQPVHKN